VLLPPPPSSLDPAHYSVATGSVAGEVARHLVRPKPIDEADASASALTMEPLSPAPSGAADGPAVQALCALSATSVACLDVSGAVAVRSGEGLAEVAALPLPSPDDEAVAIATGFVLSLPLASPAPRYSTPLPSPSPVLALAHTPRTSLLLVAAARPEICVLADASGLLLASLSAHASWVTALSPHPDGLRFASAGADGTVRVWDIGGKKVLHAFDGGHALPVKGVDLKDVGGGKFRICSVCDGGNLVINTSD
ncbi:hypothetical protein TeGR_g14442, partial [Tetraparma gracilis]